MGDEVLLSTRNLPMAAHYRTWKLEENVNNAQEKIAEYYKHVEGTTSPKEGRM